MAGNNVHSGDERNPHVHHEPGDVNARALATDWPSQMTGEPRNATCKAETDVEVLELNRESFSDLFKKHPEAVEQISEVIANRASERRERLKDTGHDGVIAFGGGTAAVSAAFGAFAATTAVFAAAGGCRSAGGALRGGVESAGCARPVKFSSGARAASATIAASQSQLPASPGTGFKLLAVMKNSPPSGTAPST